MSEPFTACPSKSFLPAEAASAQTGEGQSEGIAMIYKEPENFTIPTTKKCSKCGIEKPLTEYYSNKASKDKTISNCRTCMKAYQKAYHKVYNQSEKGKATQKAHNKVYNQSEKGKAFYQSEKRKAYNKVYNQSEKRKANQKAYNKAYNQSEKGKAYRKAYYQRRKGKPADKEFIRQGKLNAA